MNKIMFSSEIKAVFLLIIAISANFLGNSLNCGLQKGLTDSIIIRHLFLYLMIFCTIDFTAKDNMEPLDIMKRSFIIYLFYILLSKQNIETLILIFILLISIYILYLKINYEEKQGNDTLIYADSIEFLSYTVALISIVGFGFYFNRQYNEHSDSFDIITFIFGKNKCDKM